MVVIDKTRQHHLVAAANDRYIWVLAAEFLVNADLDNCAVFLKHGAIRDLVGNRRRRYQGLGRRADLPEWWNGGSLKKRCPSNEGPMVRAPLLRQFF